MNDERVFLNERGVFVSVSRVIIGGTTYSTTNITSVGKRTESAKVGCAVALIVFGILVLPVAALRMTESTVNGLLVGVFAAAMLALGVYLAKKAKPKQILVFASASGESRALISTDAAWVDRVLAAVNEAIVSRG